LDEGVSKGVGDILFPVQFKEVLVEMLFEELGACGTAMSIIDGEPFVVLFEVDG
jgi:hypothetical protein